MHRFLKDIFSYIDVLDVIDILIVAFVIYKVLGFIRESRAEQLVKGVLLLVVTMFLSDFFNLKTLNWILEKGMALGVVALVVVFQPELRRGLEYMGRSKISGIKIADVDENKARDIVREFSNAITNMSEKKIGALIVFERETTLTDICETGTLVNAEISQQLIENVFYFGSPLHDGAIIVRGDKINSAACVLPLSTNPNISKKLGTRHRAALGMSETSDSISFIVSEETGAISVAKDGRLIRNINRTKLETMLKSIYTHERKNFIMRKWHKNVKNTGKTKKEEKIDV